MKKKALIILFIVLLASIFILIAQNKNTAEELLPHTYTDLLEFNWGLEFTAENATPTGLSLTYTQKGGEHEGELLLGNAYYIEKYIDSTWQEVVPITPQITTAMAHVIQPNSSVTGEINWEPWYKQLDEGKYRICFDITNAISTQTYYAIFYI